MQRKRRTKQLCLGNSKAIELGLIGNWLTYPPSPLNCSIWKKSLRAKRAVLKKKLASTRKLLIKNSKSTQKVHERSEQYLKIILKNEFNAALRATQPSIARDCERECKAAPRGTQESMTGIHWVFVEGGKWQACSRVCLLLSGVGFSVLCTEVGNAGLCRRCRSY